MSALFEPITLRTATLPNRIVLPAMVTRLSGEDGVVNDDIRARYVRYAKGGTGLIVIEAMAVHQSKSGPLLRICSDEFKPGLAPPLHGLLASLDRRPRSRCAHRGLRHNRFQRVRNSRTTARSPKNKYNRRSSRLSFWFAGSVVKERFA